jgi:hypothetical protein
VSCCLHRYIGPLRSHRAAKRRRLPEKPIQTVETVPGSGRNEMVVDLEYGLSSRLTSLSPPRGQGIRGCQHSAHGMRPGGNRNLHPSRQSFDTTRRIRPHRAGSHLGSTLNPGGTVLTLGVFRRSRSVACIRADASPSEVHTKAMVPLRAGPRQPDRQPGRGGYRALHAA